MQRNNNLIKGFSLIEMLVVLVIISVLMGMSLIGIQGARQSSRDARRKSDIETIRSALEIRRADCNNYPATIPGVGATMTATCNGVTSTYIQSMSGDPSTLQPYYYSPGATTSYEICATLEGGGTCTGTCCAAGTTLCNNGTTLCNYKALSP